MEYAYNTDPNKELEFSSVVTYLCSGLSNTFSFGISNPLLKTVAESTVSAFGYANNRIDLIW